MKKIILIIIFVLLCQKSVVWGTQHENIVLDVHYVYFIYWSKIFSCDLNLSLEELTVKKTELTFIPSVVIGEARGEGALGMQGVIEVIFNRLKTEGYPKKISELLIPSQFSCLMLSDNTNRPIVMSDEATDLWVKALSITLKVMNKELQPITNGAIAYHDISIKKPTSKYWNNLVEVASIGNFKFYKPKEEVGDIAGNLERVTNQS
jgi:hypothetical protein